MSSTTQNSNSKKGCGAVLTIVVGLFCLTLGLVAGAGGLFAYLANSDTGLQRFGLSDAAADTGDEAASDPYPFAHPLEGTYEIAEPLDDEAVRSVLSEQRELLRRCYSEQLEFDPTTRGEIYFQFSVDGESGDTVAAVARENDTESDELAGCVVDGIEDDWSFPAPETSSVQTARFRALFLPLAPES